MGGRSRRPAWETPVAETEAAEPYRSAGSSRSAAAVGPGSGETVFSDRPDAPTWASIGPGRDRGGAAALAAGFERGAPPWPQIFSAMISSPQSAGPVPHSARGSKAHSGRAARSCDQSSRGDQSNNEGRVRAGAKRRGITSITCSAELRKKPEQQRQSGLHVSLLVPDVITGRNQV